MTTNMNIILFNSIKNLIVYLLLKFDKFLNILIKLNCICNVLKSLISMYL